MTDEQLDEFLTNAVLEVAARWELAGGTKLDMDEINDLNEVLDTFFAPKHTPTTPERCAECERELGKMHHSDCGKRMPGCPQVVADDCVAED